MGTKAWLCAALLSTTVGCGGEEFQSGASGGGGGAGGSPTGGGGSPTGGGGSPTGGGGSTSGGGGSGGVAGGSTGGSAGLAGGGGAAVECGQKPGAPTLLYTTLDNTNAITTPAVGTGIGESQGSFEPGICGDAFRVDPNGDYVRYPADSNINLDTGTADFYFKAAFTGTDALHHHLLSVPGKFQVTRDAAGQLVVGIGPSIALIVQAVDVKLIPNQWVRVTVVWKFSATGDAAWIYFDGVGAGGTTNPGPFAVPSVADDSLFIGALGEGDTEAADGVFDDFKIYDGTEEP